MKIEKNLVYFEDIDTPEIIKDYFCKIQQIEDDIEISLYGEKKKFSNQLGIDELIEQVINFKFKEIENCEKITLLEILNKEKNKLNYSINNIVEIKICAFLSLIDYIVRNTKEYPHIFKYSNEKNYYVGYFQGLFSEELINIQHIIGGNPFSFYVYKTEHKKVKLPKIEFDSSLNKIFLVIRNNFISDYEPINFEKIYKNYLVFKN